MNINNAIVDNMSEFEGLFSEYMSDNSKIKFHGFVYPVE